MNKEFLYMQKLAGIITEGEYKEKIKEIANDEGSQSVINKFLENYLKPTLTKNFSQYKTKKGDSITGSDSYIVSNPKDPMLKILYKLTGDNKFILPDKVLSDIAGLIEKETGKGIGGDVITKMATSFVKEKIPGSKEVIFNNQMLGPDEYNKAAFKSEESSVKESIRKFIKETLDEGNEQGYINSITQKLKSKGFEIVTGKRIGDAEDEIVEGGEDFKKAYVGIREGGGKKDLYIAIRNTNESKPVMEELYKTYKDEGGKWMQSRGGGKVLSIEGISIPE